MPQLIYLKTAKTAGTSIKFAIEKALPPGKCIVLEYTGTWPLEMHKYKVIILTARAVDKFIKKYPMLWKGAYKFGVVRNPYDKFVSGWLYLYKNRKPIAEVLKNPPKKHKLHHDYWHLTRSQTELFYRNGKVIADKLIQFEEVNEEVPKLLQKYNVKCESLPHKNQTKEKSKSFELYLDEECMRTIEKMYRKDFENFNFQFNSNIKTI